MPVWGLHLLMGLGTLQAPLLAYNHFVETVCVLNDCQEGLHGGGLSMGSMSQSQAGPLSHSSQSGSTAALLGQYNLRGSSEELRSKRDAIYTCACLHPTIFLRTTDYFNLRVMLRF